MIPKMRSCLGQDHALEEKSMDIFTTMQEERGGLSQSENRIADIVLNDFEFAVNASIIELAGKGGCFAADRDPLPAAASAARAFRLQGAARSHRPMSACAISSRSRRASSRRTSRGTSSPRRRMPLFLLHRGLDIPAVEQASNRLAGAEMIYAFGSGGNSSMIASELQNRLSASACGSPPVPITACS